MIKNLTRSKTTSEGRSAPGGKLDTNISFLSCAAAPLTIMIAPFLSTRLERFPRPECTVLLCCAYEGHERDSGAGQKHHWDDLSLEGSRPLAADRQSSSRPLRLCIDLFSETCAVWPNVER